MDRSLACPQCGRLPEFVRDEDGKWTAYCLHYDSLRLAVNFPSRRDAQRAWNRAAIKTLRQNKKL